MEQDHYTITIAVGILMAVLATTAVALRFEARHLRKAGYGVDDYTIVIALVFTTYSQTLSRFLSLTKQRYFYLDNVLAILLVCSHILISIPCNLTVSSRRFCGQDWDSLFC